jgi:hypothetical protein
MCSSRAWLGGPQPAPSPLLFRLARTAGALGLRGLFDHPPGDGQHAWQNGEPERGG